MKKLVEKLLSWCKKSMKMRRCVGKSTAPVTGQSVGQTGNAEGVLPSTATETVDEIVLPAAVETAGMAETIDEKATFGKSGRKKPENMLEALQCFLTARYNFRYNLLTEQTEYRGKEMPDEEYGIVAQRDLNTFCLEARSGGINCWDKDVSRLLHSRKVENYHPFLHYMSHLPQWDGVDRVTPLAVRISRKPMWVKGFHRWMLGVAAQWLGQAQDCANAVAPMLVSREQGKRKSSFCKILMPKELTPYYIDKFDLTSESGCEQKLSLFGLINMDEFDKYRAGQMPALKNLMQMTTLTFRRAHRPAFSHLPRIASFIGTSNMTDLLTDPTGSRRFLCAEVDDKIDHIIHCASITTSKVMISRPVDVIRTSLNGTENLLELAKEKQVRSMVYVSSMEMYGALNLQNDQMVTEEMTGYLNPLALRSNYPESKRMCENICVAYGTQYEVPVKIARLAQTFGAGVLPGENRVFAQFARSAMKGSDIVLHTEGKSEGNYCYTADAVRALLTILVKGENMQAYNVVNEKSHITIADMAKFVAEKIAEKPIEVVFDIPKENKFGYASDTKMHLAATRLMALGWQPETDLEESYRRLIASMKNRNV